MGVVSGYKIPFKYKVPENLNNANRGYVGAKENKRLEIAIEKLIKKGAVVQCKAIKGQILSSYFLVRKPNGSDRFILNLKYLNKFVDKEHFKMEDMRTAVQLIFPNYFVVSIDLRDAYFLIPLHKESRKFVRFNIRRSYMSLCAFRLVCRRRHLFLLKL